ncbi:LIM/homeobox protein Lhx3-like [Saccostrea echinata]|uniref:LIM/homeobox protein Lhx3-like n=1 Tax=Saccostrea echinata TaxID=191078 RepID=UPI002A7FE604|nr:LIM/homeobox protein Lhx3-like [Saccostrea echinata]
MLDCGTFPSPNSENIIAGLRSQGPAPSVTVLSDAPKCNQCSLSIYDATLVSHSEKFWHKSCFRCMLCQKELGDACFSNGKEFYCEHDFNRLYRSQCAGCSNNLSPSEIVRRIFGSLYHESCFKCTLCDRPLHTGDRVYLRDDNKLICEEDYVNLHGQEGRDSPLHPENTRNLDLSLVSKEHAEVLSRIYINNPRPSLTTCQEVSREIGLKTGTVQAWFREKRCRDKNFMILNETPNQNPGRDFFSWLGNALSPNCIPPNIELTPDVIRNGEVYLPRLSRGGPQIGSTYFPCSPDQQWIRCNSS